MSKVGSSQAAPMPQPDRQIATESHEVTRFRNSIAENMQEEAEKIKDYDPKRIIDSIHTLQSRNADRVPVDMKTLAPESDRVAKLGEALLKRAHIAPPAA